MFRLVLALALSLAAPLARAYEIENRVLFSDGSEAELLRVISTADADLMAPVIEAFRAAHPDIGVDYHVASSAELMSALYEERAPFDVAISSAMDLQMKLANDGLVLPHSSAATRLVPGWARWREHVYAFTQEPAAIVLSNAAFGDDPIPATRQDLIALLRSDPDRFRGRVGTYDVRVSGLGYLFATQDARTSETFWRLAEVMGNLEPQLYCCSSDMIDDVATGRLAVAYNVLGSYALARDDTEAAVTVLLPTDFTTVMLRTALIPADTARAEAAGLFVDHLLDLAWSDGDTEAFPFDVAAPGEGAGDPRLSRIRLGPGLLVYLDPLKRRSFIAEWESAVVQE